VVSGRAPEVQVTLADKKPVQGGSAGADPTNDLALIRITPKKKERYLPLGDSDGIQVGQKVAQAIRSAEHADHRHYQLSWPDHRR
jgi:S1-C subfamily serine protease